MFQTSFRTLQKSCSSLNCVSSFKRVNVQRIKVASGCRLHSNQSDDQGSENSGKLIQLVVTSLRVDRVAASGLGIARRKVDHSLLSGNIFLNGEKMTKKSRLVIEGDEIRRISDNQPRKDKIKFGQVTVVSIGDLTKKGNYRIELLRNKSISLPVKDF